jgi:hypothetical protein
MTATRLGGLIWRMFTRPKKALFFTIHCFKLFELRNLFALDFRIYTIANIFNETQPRAEL